MYVRFVVQAKDADSHKRQGLFQAAADLEYSNQMSPDDLRELRLVQDWFGQNLHKPKRFSRSRKPSARREAISWFKHDATEYIARIRMLAAVLGRYGRDVEMITTRRPGYIVYEDDHQIAAVPFRETPT